MSYARNNHDPFLKEARDAWRAATKLAHHPEALPIMSQMGIQGEEPPERDPKGRGK